MNRIIIVLLLFIVSLIPAAVYTDTRGTWYDIRLYCVHPSTFVERQYLRHPAYRTIRDGDRVLLHQRQMCKST